MISLRIAGRFGGEAQEIVLRTGEAHESANRSREDAMQGASASVNDDSAAAVPGPSNSSGISSVMSNVAQLIAAGKSMPQLHIRTHRTIFSCIKFSSFIDSSKKMLKIYL